MDISTLFLGSGFGLLVTLLAWGNLMREPRRDIIKLENECRQWLRLKKSDITPIFRGEDKDIKNEFRFSATDRIKALMTILGKGTITNKKELGTIRKIDDLNRERANLEEYYKKRYKLIIYLMISLFILGALAIYTEGSYLKVWDFNLEINKLYLLIVVIPIGFVIKNLIDVYRREERFVIQILDAWDSIEGK